MNYTINIDKVKTLEDVIKIIEAMELTVNYDSEAYFKLKDYLNEEPYKPQSFVIGDNP